MVSVLVSLLHSLQFLARSRASLHLEILALRHQLAVVNRARRPRLRLTATDRVLWVWLSRTWHGWRSALHIVRPETVVAWHRRGFRLFWTWTSRRRIGRPGVPADVRALIRELSTANAPRVHGELQKLGISAESVDCRQVLATAPARRPDVAHLPHEPLQPDHGRRPVREPLLAEHVSGYFLRTASQTFPIKTLPIFRGEDRSRTSHS